MKQYLLVFLMILSCNSYFAYSKLLQCPNGWTSYNTHCYKIFRNQLSSFNAQVACSSMNAYLTVINNQTEFNFITNNFLSTIQNAPFTYISPRQFTSSDFYQMSGQVWVTKFLIFFFIT
jgi:hypothetical protein